MNRVADRSSSSASLEAWMKLRAIEGVGDHIVLALVREWQRPYPVLRAPTGDLIERGCSARLAEAIARGPDRNACRRIARELHDIERTRIEVQSMLDANYPPRLLLIPDPPPLLYVAGSLHASDELAIAVGGARGGTGGGAPRAGAALWSRSSAGWQRASVQARVWARLRPAGEPSLCSAAVLGKRIRQSISV